LWHDPVDASVHPSRPRRINALALSPQTGLLFGFDPCLDLGELGPDFGDVRHHHAAAIIPVVRC